MYAKLVSSGVNSATGTIAALNNIRGVLAGSITTAAQLNANGHNTGTSYIGGTMPTSGIYTIGATGTSTSYNGSGNFYITKYHYAKGQTTGYAPARQLALNTDRDYSWRFTCYDGQYGNGYPYANTSHFWGAYTNTTYRYGQIPAYNNQTPAYWKEMHILMTDTTFAFQIITTGNDTQVDYGTFVLNDLEYSPTIDDHGYAGNVRYAPMISSWWYWGNCMERGDGLTSSDTNNAVHGVANQQFMDQFGTYRNTELNDMGNEHYGYHTSSHTNRPMLEPNPRNNIYKIPKSGGEHAHQLVPMHYKGHMDDLDNFGDPRRGRLMNWYRTTNDIGWTGDIITEGSTNYRVFRIHKTGDEAMTTANKNGCYAFAEDNIPFGG